MHVHQLHAFLAVAQEQSFRRAAAVLCMSQPAVSAQVAELERHLGVKLFDRDRRGTRLTDDGFELVPVARAAVAAVAQVELAAARSPRYRRRFTVGLLPAGLGSLAWPLMRTFHDARPELDLHVRQVTFGTALPLLHAGAIDVLGAVGPFGDADGHVTTVGHVPTIGVLAAHHPDADADVLPLDWIAPRLTSRPPDGMGEAWGKFWTLEDLSGRPRDRLRLLDPDADIAALLRIISSGLVGIWPAGVPADIPGVVTIPLDPVPQAPLQLVTTRPVRPDVAQLLDIARRLAATEPASLP